MKSADSYAFRLSTTKPRLRLKLYSRIVLTSHGKIERNVLTMRQRSLPQASPTLSLKVSVTGPPGSLPVIQLNGNSVLIMIISGNVTIQVMPRVPIVLNFFPRLCQILTFHRVVSGRAFKIISYPSPTSSFHPVSRCRGLTSAMVVIEGGFAMTLTTAFLATALFVPSMPPPEYDGRSGSGEVVVATQQKDNSIRSATCRR